MMKPKKTAKPPGRVAKRTDSARAARTTGSAADFIPANPTLPKLRSAAAGCRGCDLWKVGTQTVFGEGPRSARVVVVGEQPGDMEDRAGRPFVGPAGRLLDEAFDAADMDRDDVYVTNAVKHFKWARDARSGRRLHKTPNAREIRACFPWLEQELSLLRPTLIIALGATAAKVLLGRTFSVTKMRGIPVKSAAGTVVIATVHPSAVLRAPSSERKRAVNAFVADIRKAARHLAGSEKRERRDLAGGRRFSAWSITESPSDTSSASMPSSRK